MAWFILQNAEGLNRTRASATRAPLSNFPRNLYKGINIVVSGEAERTAVMAFWRWTWPDGATARTSGSFESKSITKGGLKTSGDEDDHRYESDDGEDYGACGFTDIIWDQFWT